MHKGYRYIDADSHVLEPAALWEEYLEPQFRAEMPFSYVGYAGQPLAFRERVWVNGVWALIGPEGANSPAPGLGEVYSEYARKGFTPDCYLDALEQTGMDYMVVYPTVGLYFTAVPGLSAETAAAYCRAYNNWLHDFTAACGGRVLGAGKVDLRDAREAAREARRCVVELGLRAITINPEPVNEHRLSDLFFEPLWSELEDLDVPMGVHAGFGSAAEEWVRHLVPNRALGAGNITFVVGNMVASMALVLGGVLERHPKLRVAHLETGSGWVPFWLEKIEAGIQGANRKGGVKGLSLTPLEYFQRQCFISADPDDPFLKHVVATIGEDSVITASDFSHPEGRGWTHAIDKTLALEGVPESAKRKIMWDNPSRLYSIREDGEKVS